MSPKHWSPPVGELAYCCSSFASEFLGHVVLGFLLHQLLRIEAIMFATARGLSCMRSSSCSHQRRVPVKFSITGFITRDSIRGVGGVVYDRGLFN